MRSRIPCNQYVADEQYMGAAIVQRVLKRQKRQEVGGKRGRAGNEGSRGALVCLCVLRLSLSMEIAQTNIFLYTCKCNDGSKAIPHICHNIYTTAIFMCGNFTHGSA